MNIHLRSRSVLSGPTLKGVVYPLITAVEELQDLRRENFGVVGCPGYVRYDELDRTRISDFVYQTLESFKRGNGCQGSIIWADSGTGKTSLIKGIASAHESINFINLNLGSPTFRRDLRVLDRPAAERNLVLIDEVDSQKRDRPYEALLSSVDKVSAQRVFVLAGSSPKGLDGMVADMIRRPKGSDLANRISGRFSVPPLCLGDRAVIFASSVEETARARNSTVTLIEKFAILYVLTAEGLANGHRIRDFAAAAVYRMGEGETRMRFSHLFDRGDQQLFTFHSKHEMAAKRFDGRWVRI